jgi:hypothetical protein
MPVLAEYSSRLKLYLDVFYWLNRVKKLKRTANLILMLAVQATQDPHYIRPIKPPGRSYQTGPRSNAA